MEVFKLILSDDRQSAAQVLDVVVRDEARVRQLAFQVLRRSRHHQRVEVVNFDGRQVFNLARCRHLEGAPRGDTVIDAADNKAGRGRP
jgi:hypothetical protein